MLLLHLGARLWRFLESTHIVTKHWTPISAEEMVITSPSRAI